jgi:hypothetical protein
MTNYPGATSETTPVPTLGVTGPVSTGLGSLSNSSDFSAFNRTLFPNLANGTTSSDCTSSLTISTEGSGIEYASSCDNFKKLVYWGSTTNPSIPCVTDVGLLHPYYDTILSTRTSDIVRSLYSTEKLCDGIPRAVGTPTSILSVQATITDFQWSPKTDQMEAFSAKIMATPSLLPLLNPCSIQPKDCAQLWRNWEIAYVSKIQNGGRGHVPDFPFCDYVTTNCNKCTIYGGEVKLLYFPETTTSRDICAASTPSPGGMTILPFNEANGMYLYPVWTARLTRSSSSNQSSDLKRSC